MKSSSSKYSQLCTFQNMNLYDQSLTEDVSTNVQILLTSQASGSRTDTLVTTDQTNLEAFITIVSVEPTTCAFPQILELKEQHKRNLIKTRKYSVMHSGITTCIISTTNYVPIFVNHHTSMTTPRSYMRTLSVRLRPLQLLQLNIIYTSFSVES